MIDIHSHILYGIDDGAQSLEESVEMCRDAYENGCDTLVLTPHFFDFKHLHEFTKERDRKFEILADALAEEEIPLKLFSGAELFLSNKIFAADSLDDLTINHSRYMLCEMPLGPFRTDNVPMWFDELLEKYPGTVISGSSYAISPEFKKAGNKVYLIKPEFDENGLPVADHIKPAAVNIIYHFYIIKIITKRIKSNK